MFEHPEYDSFFFGLLCADGSTLKEHTHLFDLRDPVVKRRAFSRKRAWSELSQVYGIRCQLRVAPDCEPENPTVVDHIIPLSSNRLHKELRGGKAMPGRKVATESFGSNDVRNLALACANCNSLKQNRFLSRQELQRILARG